MHFVDGKRKQNENVNKKRSAINQTVVRVKFKGYEKKEIQAKKNGTGALSYNYD